MSDALGGTQEMGSVLAYNAGFRQEFQQLVGLFVFSVFLVSAGPLSLSSFLLSTRIFRGFSARWSRTVFCLLSWFQEHFLSLALILVIKTPIWCCCCWCFFAGDGWIRPQCDCRGLHWGYSTCVGCVHNAYQECVWGHLCWCPLCRWCKCPILPQSCMWTRCLWVSYNPSAEDCHLSGLNFFSTVDQKAQVDRLQI